MVRKALAAAIIALIIVAWLQAKEQQPPAATAQTAPPQMRCSASDFTVLGFKPTVYDDCRRTPCPVLKLTGRLVNNCAIPAGARLKFTALDKAGDVVDTVEGWPASTRNIAPGDAYPFDMGPLMRYRSNMSRFSASVIEARTWR